MSDLRPSLDRVAGRVAPRSDALERLDRRRQRKHRNRRVGTVVLAFVVAIAGSVGAFAAFRHPPAVEPATPTAPFHALWPEMTRAEAEATQRKVDAGEGDTQWRQSAIKTTQLFAAQALGWGKVNFAVPPGDWDQSGGPVTITVTTPPVSCPTPGCPPGLEKFHVQVTLQRLVRADATGIWSVTQVASGELALPLQPGQDVVSGQEFAIPFSVPDGLELQAASTYLFGDCATLTVIQIHQAKDEVSFRAGLNFENFEGRCTQLSASADLNLPANGSVFVVLAVKGGKLYDPFTLQPPADFADTPVAVAAVPVHFVPAARSSGSYPRGAFESCPDVSGAIPLESGAEQEASRVAVRFARAYLADDAAVVATLQDPSVKEDANWAVAGTPATVSVIESIRNGGPLAEHGCGPDVSAYTVAVTIDDGTSSASLDFTLFLIHRADGWTVWGSY
jgi:hypothetical protein